MKHVAVPMMLLLIVALPAVAADAVIIPMSQVESCAPLATQMAACVQETPVSLTQINQQDLMVPMSMPVRIHRNQDGGVTLQPLVVTTPALPTDAVLMPMNVPVSLSNTPTQNCLVADLDEEMAGLTLLMPSRVNGADVLEPVSLKQEQDRLLILPTSISAATSPTSVPMYIDGEMVMFPLDCRTTADGITFCPRCPAGQVTVLTRKQ